MSFLKSPKSTILITGGGSGIGLSLAKKLIALGHEVIAVGRTQEKLDAAKQSCPKLITFTADIKDEQGRKALVQKVLTEFPQVNVLVNNAALCGTPPALDKLKERDWSALMDEVHTNLVGLMHLTVLFLPHLNKMTNAAVVNVSSQLAFKAFPVNPVYAVTKAGVHSFTISLREQMQGGPISMIEIVPPLVNTTMPREEIRDQGVNSDVFAHSVVTQMLSGKEEVFSSRKTC